MKHRPANQEKEIENLKHSTANDPTYHLGLVSTNSTNMR